MIRANHTDDDGRSSLSIPLTRQIFLGAGDGGVTIQAPLRIK